MSPAATYPSAESDGRTLTFSLSANFTPGLEYYILLDSGKCHQVKSALVQWISTLAGVAVGNNLCSQESFNVTDTTFWNFSTGK